MLWILFGSIIALTLIAVAVGLVVSAKRKSKEPIDPMSGMRIQMTPQLQQELENRVRQSFQARIDEVTSGFGVSLAQASKSISDQLGTISATTVQEEMAKFQQTLATVRTTSEQASQQLSSAAATTLAELKSASETGVAQLKAAQDATLTELKTNSESTAGALHKASEDSLTQLQAAATQTMTNVQQTVASTMQQLQDAATGTVAKIAAEAENQSTLLHESMQAEVKAEQSLLINKFDNKMADIVTAYLAEALGGGIDLGTQKAYLMKTLESHREDIKKDLLGEA